MKGGVKFGDILAEAETTPDGVLYVALTGDAGTVLASGTFPPEASAPDQYVVGGWWHAGQPQAVLTVRVPAGPRAADVQCNPVVQGGMWRDLVTADSAAHAAQIAEDRAGPPPALPEQALPRQATPWTPRIAS
jgi:hypothetical protein